ncbi:MAG: oxygenase MpaB family protein, partial [Acidimicrobiaceae bacterium]|nr:oxygenase MpaB family protein [Acidimicrobiaceae bacterium]
GGLETRGDGWRLSVRIRLVHAKVRQLFNDSDEWDSAAQGVPLSAAQVGYALTSFSARMLQHMKGLGASYDDTERDGFMAVWRYSGYLMGIPETILYHDYDDALELFRVGGLCEPDPGMESVVLANSLVNSAPVVAGITEPAARRKLAKYVFLVSRAMIGNPMADNLQYPPNHTFGVLPWFRFQRRYHQFLKKRFPKLSRESSFTAFNTLLEVSALQELDIDYKLPDHIHSEESRWW